MISSRTFFILSIVALFATFIMIECTKDPEPLSEVSRENVNVLDTSYGNDVAGNATAWVLMKKSNNNLDSLVLTSPIPKMKDGTHYVVVTTYSGKHFSKRLCFEDDTGLSQCVSEKTYEWPIFAPPHSRH